MPHDVETATPREDAPQVLSAAARRGCDARELALLGAFTLVDAVVLVLLWMAM